MTQRRPVLPRRPQARPQQEEGEVSDMTLEQIDAIEALAKKATPGPWMPVRSVTCGHLRAAHNYQEDARKEWTDADLSLMAELRNSLPSLLSAARRGIAAERVVEAAKDFAEGFGHEWAKAHAVNDHLCDMDHKDEMAVAESVTRILDALAAMENANA